MNKFNLLLITIFIFSGYTLFAQFPDKSSIPGMDTSGFSFKKLATDAVKISGDIGTNGELYSVSGKKSQRPGSSGRLFLRPSISLFDKVTINFDLFLSSEGSGARQDINTVKFNPEWSWGKLYYGDFNMEISKFTLTDVLISGYGIDLYPGIFKLQGFSGKSQKAIALDAAGSMYERTIYGGKIGLGEEAGSHLHINFLRSYDNMKSLSRDIFRQIDTVNTASGTRVDTNYTGVTPQENLIAGINWGLNLFNNTFKMKSEIAMSLFTQDLYSAAVENKDLPEDINQYYTPRLTTSGDVAFNGEMSINTRPVQIKSGYTLVGPGYTSLGMGTLINDRQIITGGLGFNLFSGNLAIQTNFQRQNDNTANQKLFTTERNNIAVMVSARPIKPLSVSVVTNMNNMGNDANNDTLKIDNTTASYGINTNYMFEAFKYQNSVTFGYSTQNAESKSKIRGDNKVTSQNINLGLNTTISKQLNAAVVMTFSNVDLGPRGQNSTQSFTGKVNHKMFDNKLSNVVAYTLVTADASTSNVLTYRAGYEIFQSSTISLNTRATFFKGKGANSIKFSEYMTTFDWSYRF